MAPNKLIFCLIEFLLITFVRSDIIETSTCNSYDPLSLHENTTLKLVGDISFEGTCFEFKNVNNVVLDGMKMSNKEILGYLSR